jgi:hypothetical protein
MTDITMCFNGCDKKDNCRRWTAPASSMQSYSDFKPDDDGDCHYFWDNNGTKKQQQVEMK